jgi:hypothetical protein
MENKEKARLVVCPKCHAPVGKPCMENTMPLDPHGFKALNNRVIDVTHIHRERIEAANATKG